MKRKALKGFISLMIAVTMALSYISGIFLDRTIIEASAEDTSSEVSNLEEFQTAISNPAVSVITLTSNIALTTGTYNCGNKQILTGSYYFTVAETETVHFNNADINMGGNSAFQNSGIFYGDNIDAHDGKIVFVYGLSSSNTYIIVTNSRFHDNRNNQQTFTRTSGTIVIDNCSFYNNVNTAPNNDGAIIETNSGGMVYIYRSIFADNCGYAHAGCINDYGGYLYIADTIFAGNTIKADYSYYSGGGIRGSGGLKMMISSVLAYNKYADGAKDGDIGSMQAEKSVNNVIGYVGGTSTGTDASGYFSEFEETCVGNGTDEGTVAFSHPKIDANGNLSVNSSALNQLWSTTNAQLDYSDLNDIKLTYTDPTTEETVVLGSSWTINFYNNDGTDNVTVVNVPKLSSSSYYLPDGPTREGYRFLGWYNNSSLTGTLRSAGSYYSIQEDTSFYAGWIKSDRIITDSTQSASHFTITSEINDHQSNFYSVDRDSEVTITSNTRLLFSSGSFTETKTDDIYTYIGTVSDDITVRTAYTITFDSNGGSEIDDLIVQYGNYTSLSSYTPSKTCYSFAGWYDSTLTTRYTYTYGYNDSTYYAKWEENHDWDIPTYTWADDYSTSTRTVVCKNDSSHKRIDTVDTTSEIDGDDTVFTAIFSDQQTKYSHTPNISNEGNQNSNYSNNYTMNEVVTIEGADSLHVVLTWGGENSSWDWVSVWAGEHPDYTASANYSSGINAGTITDGKFGGGNHVNSSNTVEFDVAGDSVTFAFKSDSSGCGDGYGYYAVVTGSTTDVQTKRVPTGSVIIITFDSDGGTAVERQSVENGGTATEPAAPTKDSHRFDGWYIGDTLYDFDSPVTESLTLTAKWTELTYHAETEPTCLEEGTVEYWTDGEKYYSDTNGLYELSSIAGDPALGHDWLAPTYTWSDDNSTVTAARVCGHDSSHTETETVSTTSAVISEHNNTGRSEIYFCGVHKYSFRGSD